MKSQEKILREFLRKEIISEQLRRQKEEYLVRKFIRNIIQEAQEEAIYGSVYLYEAKDKANPHWNTGINKLRDALGKAKASIKMKFQQLTTSEEQRESFRNHFLGAMVRHFEELDALNAQGKPPEEIEKEMETNPEPELEAPPEEKTSDDMADDIDADLNALLENILKELEVEVEEEGVPEENDLVSNEIEKEKEGSKSQVEKDIDKKREIEKEREQFSTGIGGDSTGRNQAFDAFNLVQSYFSDAYLDLNNPTDQEMFKKWGLYNSKLLLDKYEEELESDPEAPNIENPA